MGLAAPPVFNNPKDLALHVHNQLLNLGKEQFAEYIKMLLHSSLRQEGTSFTPNGNGQPMIDRTIATAYEGWGKYKDQYCPLPQKTEQIGSTIKWYNKRQDRYCSINAAKDGNTFAIDAINIFLDKKQEDDAVFKTIQCTAPTTVNNNTTTGSPSGNYSFKKGDKVWVEENGKWYPATVLETKTNEWYIHYDGYSAKYDLWIGPERIKRNN